MFGLVGYFFIFIPWQSEDCAMGIGSLLQEIQNFLETVESHHYSPELEEPQWRRKESSSVSCRGWECFHLNSKNQCRCVLLKGLPARKGKLFEFINDHSGSVWLKEKGQKFPFFFLLALSLGTNLIMFWFCIIKALFPVFQRQSAHTSLTACTDSSLLERI